MAAKFGPVFAFLARTAEPFTAEDLLEHQHHNIAAERTKVVRAAPLLHVLLFDLAISSAASRITMIRAWLTPHLA
jgi:hypothetical protein